MQGLEGHPEQNFSACGGRGRKSQGGGLGEASWQKEDNAHVEGRESTRVGPRREPGTPSSLFQLLHLTGQVIGLIHKLLIYRDFFPVSAQVQARNLLCKEAIS